MRKKGLTDNLQCKAIFYNFYLIYSDAIVGQVLDELGLQLTDKLSGLPEASGSLVAAKGKTAVPAVAAGGEDADADLQARLDNLRRE